VWKYLVWDETLPAGTSLTLRLRTAATQTGLESAPWIDYTQSGTPFLDPGLPAGRWIQYQAVLTTTDTLVTPMLSQIIVYYDAEPTAIDVVDVDAVRSRAALLGALALVIGLTGIPFTRRRRGY